jgi:leader peptidase (prepilin peptidase)/N-methyltransferase
MTWYAETGVVLAAVGAAGGLGVPSLIARIPEPAPDPDEEAVPEPKEPYAAIAALPRLRTTASLASALAAGLCGARLGWGWDLLLVAYLVPVGVALAIVDWRTRLLPTRIIAPSYAVVVALCLLAAVLGDDVASLIRAGWGWLVSGGTFLLLWLVYPRGMGYGDVRLSGVLGLALGFLGWCPLLVGVWSGFLLGGLGGTVLTLLKVVDRKAYPFGPFMLLGALVGVLAGDWFAALYTVG